MNSMIVKLRETIDLADRVGQSRRSNCFAMNERATKRLVDVQMEMEAALSATDQLFADMARWRRCTSLPRKVEEFGTVAAYEEFCTGLWKRLDAALEAPVAATPRGLSPSQEPKYTVDGSSIVNRASGKRIPDDEPVFIMRARDTFAAGAIYNYALDCPPGAHREAVLKRFDDFSSFAKQHPERMREPDTAAAPGDPADLLDANADSLLSHGDSPSAKELNPVEPSALDASVAELEAFDARESSEPLSPSEGEALSLVLHEFKRLRAQAAQATTPDPAVVTTQDLEALAYVEDLVRSSGFADKADRLSCMHEVLNRVAQGREASHYRASYDRAVQRLVLMRELIPAEALRAFEVEWRTRKREPLADAVELNLSEAVRGELRQMAEHCGAVSYSPPPMRAVRGVSLTFEQLEALAVLISGPVWPVRGEGKR